MGTTYSMYTLVDNRVEPDSHHIYPLLKNREKWAPLLMLLLDEEERLRSQNKAYFTGLKSNFSDPSS